MMMMMMMMMSMYRITIYPPQDMRALTTYQSQKRGHTLFSSQEHNNIYRFLVCKFHAQAYLSVDLFFFRKAQAPQYK